MKRALLLLVLVLVNVGCRGATDTTARVAPTIASAASKAALSKTAPPSRVKSPAETEREELQRLVATVTAEDRARFEQDVDQIEAAYRNAMPKARVLFEVPARECCSGASGCEEKQRDFRGLCYQSPDREAWGLGPLTIDDAGVFWMQDAEVDRIVGFDKTGKLVRGYYLDSGLVASNLVATANEFWLDSFSSSEDNTWLVRVDRDRGTTRDYGWKDLIGQEHQGWGWQMPGNPNRIVRWGAEQSWNVVDVTFLDDTRMQVSPPHPLRVNGHRYWLDCDSETKKPATLVIDDHATPAVGCSQLDYVGPAGDTVAGIPFLHYDVHGKLIGMAVREQPPFYVLKSGGDTAVGPDGKIYQYVTRKHSVQFVELPLFPQ